ncbi:MAG: cupin domain-containing protein [Ignavibacteria bacterium]|nr:cupin domain-containing protein [Ignavibacteria bacterium]
MSEINVKNIFHDIPEKSDEEFLEVLFQNNFLKMERIVSEGHSSPKNFWYDQDKNEFVLLLSGNAIISFEDGNSIELFPGDYFIIPAHKKHRVDYTDPNEKNVWFTLFFN